MDTGTLPAEMTQTKTSLSSCGDFHNPFWKNVPPYGRTDQDPCTRNRCRTRILKAAKKRDSLGVCFCPMDYHTFLKAHVPEGEIIPGTSIMSKDRKSGNMEGYPFYHRTAERVRYSPEQSALCQRKSFRRKIR